MRLMLLAELDTPTANQAITDGRLPKLTEGLLEHLRPETAYFYARGGRRALTLVVDAPDNATLAQLAEPLWQELNAEVEILPCMNAHELRAAFETPD